MTVISRGIHNNNPGNIRLSGDKWQGLAEQQTDKAFFTFQNPVYGIRALARLLIKYQDKYLINTISGIICRWAPAGENNVAAYIRDVARRSGFASEGVLDLHKPEYLKPIVKAIIWHENGSQPYTEEQIDKALVLAGVEPTPKPLTQTRTIKGAQVTASAGLVAATSGVIAQAAPAMPILSTLSHLAQDNARGLLITLGLLVIAAAAYIAWARIDQRSKGIA